MEPLLLYLLFPIVNQGIAYVGKKMVEIFGQPLWRRLETAVNLPDETKERWQAFATAYDQAKERLIREAPNLKVAQLLQPALAMPRDQYLILASGREQLESLAQEIEKATLIAQDPDVTAVTTLCLFLLDKQRKKQPAKPEAELAIIFFIHCLQDTLVEQPLYREAILAKMTWQTRESAYQGRTHYLAQMKAHYQTLDFVGIPELRDRQSLHLQDIFIHLQATENRRQDSYTPQLEGGSVSDVGREAFRIRAERYHQETTQAPTSINEVLQQQERLVILGDPGAGKTTLLKYITLALADNRSDRIGLSRESYRLPVFIRLYDFVTKRKGRVGDYSLLEYLRDQAENDLALRLPPTFFEEALSRGECCVCLDGLDELGGTGVRREITRLVTTFANHPAYRRNRFIITSRLVGYEDAPLNKQAFAHYTVQPLADEAIKRFIRKWYHVREINPTRRQERAQHLIDTVMKELRIKTLATNPLLLTIIALVHRVEAELPHERVKLYDKCVTALVETWESVKELDSQFKESIAYEYRRRILEHIAFWLHNQPGEQGQQRQIQVGDLRLQVCNYLMKEPMLALDKNRAWREAQTFIQLAQARTGVLVERGENVFVFAHLMFQEYLAAKYVEYRFTFDIEAMWQLVEPHLHDAHWREVILLLLGSLNKFHRYPTELVERIFKREDTYEPILHRHLYLAASALADKVMVNAKLHQQIVDKLIQVSQEEWVARSDAFNMLGHLAGDVRAAHGLLELAQDPQVDSEVRRDAARVLGQLGQTDEAVIIGLLTLAQDPQVNSGVRSDAAYALGQLGQTDEAARMLLGLAQDPQVDDWVRRDACDSLKNLI